MAFPSTDTFSTLIDEIILALTGTGQTTDLITTLIGNIDADDLVLMVSDSSSLSRGLLEIGDELVYAGSVSGATATIPPWGRGYRGSTATAHVEGEAVYIAPSWPRSVIAREINNTIRSLYPTLFAVKTTTITVAADKWQYGVPSDLERILACDWQWVNYGWRPVQGWEAIHSADTADFPTGKAVSLSEPLPSGASVRITYAARPTLLSTASDVFTATGLPASCKDVVLLGTTARMLPWADTARVASQAAEAAAMTASRPTGTATQLAVQLSKQYQLRLAEERTSLLQSHPSRSHFVR